MPKLNIGDKVKIVNVRNCEFGCNTNMTDCIGQTTVITHIYFEGKTGTRYSVQIDKGVYSWSANCLKPVDCKCKFIIKNE